MKKIVFLMSHLGSGHNLLSNFLDKTSRIQLFDIKKIYSNLLDLDYLTNSIHKRGDVSAIYLEELLFNHRLTDRKIVKYFKFIYLIREPHGTLNEILDKYKGYTPLSALRYYQFRLRGMFEYAKRSKGFFLTYNDLEKKEKFSELVAYLNLKDIPSFEKTSTDTPDLIPNTILKEAEDVYERYLYSFNQIFKV